MTNHLGATQWKSRLRIYMYDTSTQLLSEQGNGWCHLAFSVGLSWIADTAFKDFVL